jgi:hypothetical protein
MVVCPHCGQPFTFMQVSPMSARDPSARTWKAAVFSCPLCFKAIGAGFDAIALQAQITAEIRQLKEETARLRRQL